MFLLLLGSSCDVNQSDLDEIAQELEEVAKDAGEEVIEKVGEEAKNKAMGVLIDGYIRLHSSDSQLIDYGERFVYWGRDQNVDPRLMVAIARQESRFATDPKACGGRANELYNAWGLLGGGGCLDLVSWEIGIESVAKNIVKHYFNHDLRTVEQISGKYCQSGCGDWSGNVSTFMEDLGGNPDDLTFHVFGE